MALSVEVAMVNGCLQVLRAPSVAGAEPSVVSPIDEEGTAMGGELGDVGKMAQGREFGKEWKMKMEEEILAMV